jgi:alanyl-tRNA synthetase
VVGIVLDKTPFYAESGGQVADAGRLVVTSADGEQVALQVLDVQSEGGYVLHTCVVADGASDANASTAAVSEGTEVSAEVDYDRRTKTAPNHTMTHILALALRKVLASSVQQKGSFVSDEKLRFDFNHTRPLQPHELVEVEDLVNGIIQSKVRAVVVP